MQVIFHYQSISGTWQHWYRRPAASHFHIQIPKTRCRFAIHSLWVVRPSHLGMHLDRRPRRHCKTFPLWTIFQTLSRILYLETRSVRWSALHPRLSSDHQICGNHTPTPKQWIQNWEAYVVMVTKKITNVVIESSFKQQTKQTLTFTTLIFKLNSRLRCSQRTAISVKRELKTNLNINIYNEKY